MSKRGANSNLDQDNWDHDEAPEEMGTFKQASATELQTRTFKRARRRGVDTVDDSTAPVFKNFTAFEVKKSGTQAPSFSFGNTNSSLGKSEQSPIFSFGTKPNSGISTGISSVGFTNDAISTKENKSPSETFSMGSKLESKEEKTSTASITAAPKLKFGSITTTAQTPSENPTLGGEKKQLLPRPKSSYLSNLKSLNLALCKWVKEHIDKNPYVNLSPVFEDYNKHLFKIKNKTNKSNKTENIAKVCEEKSEAVNEKLVNKQTVGAKNDLFSSNKLGSPNKVGQLTHSSTSNSLDSSSSNEKFSSSDSAKSSLFSFVSKTDTTKETEKTTGFSFGNNVSSGTFSFSTSNTNAPLAFGTSKTKSPISFGTSNTTAPVSFGTDNSKLAFKFEPSQSNFSFGTSTSTIKPVENSQPDDQPPKVDVSEVKEEGSVYEKRVKLFYKKDDNYVDKGVGTLFLKPVDGKTQLIVRAMTNLGNILLNILLTSSIPTQRTGKNNVLIMCIPNPPINPKEPSTKPVSMLIRVKTAEDADELLNKLEEYKK